MDINLGINIVFCGLAIVFLMLLLLIGVMYIFGFLSNATKKQSKAKPIVENIKIQPDVKNDNGVDEETVAAISAAIYYLYSDSNVAPKITFIKPANSRPAWAKAGISQNTKAF